MTEPRKFQKRPIVIEAVRLDGYGAFVRAVSWINGHGGKARLSSGPDSSDVLLIDTLEGTMEANEGWYVIKGIKGEFYPCDPDVFVKSYDDVPAPDVMSGPAASQIIPAGNQSKKLPHLSGGAALG